MPKTLTKSITLEEARARASLTVKEFAALAGVSPMTIYRTAQKGKIESVRIGGRVMIPRTVFAPMLGVEL
ncbi:MAG: helix-turn-helix domain-containing protein [Spirochaetota bacterium]|nr:helix-turn-helix domain-containing protein [Spirochaetota bacterium]